MEAEKWRGRWVETTRVKRRLLDDKSSPDRDKESTMKLEIHLFYIDSLVLSLGPLLPSLLPSYSPRASH